MRMRKTTPTLSSPNCRMEERNLQPDSSPRVPPRPVGRQINPKSKPATRPKQKTLPRGEMATNGVAIQPQPAPPPQMLEKIPNEDPSYGQEVYMSTAWVPLRRDPKEGNRPLSSDSNQLKRQSGLNQLVIEKRGSRAYQEDPKVCLFEISPRVDLL